jgi:hypothetical protein
LAGPTVSLNSPRHRRIVSNVIRRYRFEQEMGMSERNEQNNETDGKAIRARALPDWRYLARTSPPMPDAAMQEAHKLIEADKGNTRQ